MDINAYVTQTPDGSWRLTGTRVSLDSILSAYWQGRVPEAIALDFPSVTLEQIYGAIAFYLGHRGELDPYLASQDERWERLRQESERANGPLLARLRAAAGGRQAANHGLPPRRRGAPPSWATPS